MQCIICIICMDLPPISTYWLLSPPKSSSGNRSNVYLWYLVGEWHSTTLWCRSSDPHLMMSTIDSESLGMDEHCGALTPSWDRLLTEGELEDGLSCPSLTTSASARPGLVATWYCTYFILILCSPRRYPFWSVDKRFKLSFRSAEYLSWIKRPKTCEEDESTLHIFLGKRSQDKFCDQGRFFLHFPELVKICRFSANSRPLFSCISNALPLHSFGWTWKCFRRSVPTWRD